MKLFVPVLTKWNSLRSNVPIKRNLTPWAFGLAAI